MSRFFIIDQSLKGLGGHHFDYVQQITQAAVQQNLEVVVVAHQSFSRRSPLEHYAKVLPHFRQTTYCRYSLLAGLRAMHRRPPLQREVIPPRPRLRLAPTEDSYARRDHSDPPQRELSSRLSSRAFAGGLVPQAWAACRRTLSAGWQTMAHSLGQLRESAGRHRAVNGFARDCQRLFPQLGLMSSDHVFFTTISDLELAGLLIYWLGSPESYLPRWHLQFHFDVFQGRVPDYRKQYAALDPLRCLFEDVDRAVPAHQIHYYATTAAIADQYQRLASRPIQELAYPINVAFQRTSLATSDTSARIYSHPGWWQPSQALAADLDASPSNAPGQFSEQVSLVGSWAAPSSSSGDQSDRTDVLPLPVTPAGVTSINFPELSLWSTQARGIPIVLAGGVRAEKGQKGLREVWSELKQSILDPGLGFLVCQRPEKTPWYRKRFSVAGTNSSPSQDAQVQYLPHPLSSAQYQELIRNAGIGLLTYDPQSYANRRAGIFGEYLAAGIPTLVPSGTWMAQQLAQYQPAYHRQLREQCPPRICWTHSDFDWTPWNVPAGQGSISFDGGDVPAYGWSPALPPLSSQLIEPTTANLDAAVATNSTLTSAHGSNDTASCDAGNPTPSVGTRLLNLRFHWVWPKEAGTYCRVEILFYDRHRQVIGVETQNVGQDNSGCGQSVLCEIPAGADHFRLGLSNAYHERNATVQRLLVDIVESPTSIAAATVGLTYDHPSQIPARLMHMCRHYQHYRQSALAVATGWFAQHDPQATVRQLIGAAAQRRWVA